MFLPTALKGVTIPKMNYSLYSRLGFWSAWKNRRSINILKMRLGAFRRPFEHGRRGHQNFRSALPMKMSDSGNRAVSLLSVCCTAQVACGPPTPCYWSPKIRGKLKSRERWWQECTPGAGSWRWAQPFLVPFKCHIFGRGWCLAALLNFLLPSFPKRKCVDHLCALGVSLPVRGSWDCSSNTTLCCSGSCIKGHCCCLHDVQGK